MQCEECYIDKNRITPLIKPRDCLLGHTQYICGTCGRCICMGYSRGLQRWNFPFKSLEIAKMYLRTADYTMKKNCGIYEIEASNGRRFYKIFANEDDFKLYLKNNKDKTSNIMKPVFIMMEYKEYKNTMVKKLTPIEVEEYMLQR